jgi:hypothetical protein
MNSHNIILLFLAIFVTTSQPITIDLQYELIEKFLTVKNIYVAILYSCWSFKGIGLYR